MRANEARYFRNRHDHAFVVEPAKKAKRLVDYVQRILKEERDIVIESRPPVTRPFSQAPSEQSKKTSR